MDKQSEPKTSQSYPLLKRISGYLVFAKGLGVGTYAETALAQKESEIPFIACKVPAIQGGKYD